MGHKRRDITPLPVLFWTIPKYPNYIVVYRPQSKPLHKRRCLREPRDRLGPIRTRI
jgi:hypothetical protein